MIRLASIIDTFEAAFLHQYRDRLLPSHRQALNAIKHCRSVHSPMMLAHCDQCQQQRFVPHSCGHRSCPHCQHHQSQQWIEHQLNKLVPAEYFLVTFTLPAELRALAWQHQRTLYSLMLRCSWETLRTFAQNDTQLSGSAGAISVLHTHSRRLDYHPHVHVVMPAAVIDEEKKRWRSNTQKKSRNRSAGYLFPEKALAKVFRAKLLEAITQEGLALPVRYPETWVVDCQSVGRGEKALIYLGRYLYKGVIQEKDILACDNGQVTFRYQDGKTKRWLTRTLPGTEFLWLILQHVLPKGFRRTRDFGFLHANSKRLIALLQWLIGIDPRRALAQIRPRPSLCCPECGASMRIVKTRIPPPAPALCPWPAG
jgi:hypothetical protein